MRAKPNLSSVRDETPAHFRRKDAASQHGVDFDLDLRRRVLNGDLGDDALAPVDDFRHFDAGHAHSDRRGDALHRFVNGHKRLGPALHRKVDKAPGAVRI